MNDISPRKVAQYVRETGRPAHVSERRIVETPLCTMVLSLGRLTILSDRDKILVQATSEELDQDKWRTQPDWFRVVDHVRCLVYGDPMTANARVAKQVAEFIRLRWKQSRGTDKEWVAPWVVIALDDIHSSIADMVEARVWDPTKGESC